MDQRSHCFIVILPFALLCGCGGQTASDPPPPPPVTPAALSYADLFSTDAPSSPIADEEFAPPANASPPTESFEGRLDLGNPFGEGGFTPLLDEYGMAADSQSPWRHPPPINLDFVQDGGALIPATQGLVYTGHPAWNIIIGPGRVWQESGDSGYMRASLPLTLVQRNLNCTHNGLMTFLFNDTLSPNISHVRYQFTQETCSYFKFNMWGKFAATYTPHPVAGSATLRSDHAAEMANRLPTRPVSALATDFPGVDPSAFVSDYASPPELTTYGVVANGINYAGPCPTRFGTYPFCSEMRMASWSTAKSILNSIAMMRLGQVYGSEVYSQLIRDYVPESIRGGDWSAVTFGHTLDMTTGNYQSANYMADDNGADGQAFIRAESYDAKMDLAFRPFPHQAAPGTTWVYQTFASFILNQAMTRYLQQRRGDSWDTFNLLREDVLKPIHISQGFDTLRTDNRPAGMPLGGLGLFFIPDDVAKVAKLLTNDAGGVSGSQVLDSRMLAASLFQDPADLGMQVPDSHPRPVPNTYRYNNGFWAKRMAPVEFPQYACDFWVPYMSGHGGISIVLIPNGVAFYAFSDDFEYTWFSAVHEANKLAPVCP
ncbi:MAG: hypothetical protein ACE145_19860 [Terriglobia bacterium]